MNRLFKDGPSPRREFRTHRPADPTPPTGRAGRGEGSGRAAGSGSSAPPREPSLRNAAELSSRLEPDRFRGYSPRMKPLALLVVPPLLAATAGQALDYERDLMPMLTKKCGECHSRAAGQSKGGLAFDDPRHLLSRLGKNNLVVPGDWDASYLFISVYRPEGDKDAMPPKGKGERLDPEEVELVQRWITEGAPLLGKRGPRGEMPASIAEAEAPAPKPAGPREWTNKEGRTILATLLGIEDGNAILRLPNGTVHRYSVADLSEESQAALAQ